MHYMKKMIIALAVIIALSGVGISATLLATPSQKPVEAQKTIEPITVAKLHELVNQERVIRGIAPLVLDERLNTSAQVKADDMTNDGYYNHVDPVTGVSGYKLAFDTTGTDCIYASENMNNEATTHTTSETVASWMTSEAHRNAILETRYELVGYAVSGEYIVQHFCDLR